MGSARDLRPSGPLSSLDRAIALARESTAEVAAPAWAGGALVAAIVLGLYYVERVEGITTLRLPFALALVCAWWGRALLLGRAARHVAGTLWDARPPAEAGRAIDVLRTSVVVGLGLWIWSWLLVLGSLGGPVGVVLVLPFFALRGAVAPSWIARSACEAEAGWRGLFRAASDSHGRRFAGVLVEAMLLFGALGLTLNLYALTAIGILLARSFGGLDVTTIETFLSPENTFVMLAVAALALVILEPVRAAVAALAYVDARVRAEGLDLRAAIEDAIEHASRRGSASAKEAAARAALVLFAISLAAAPALAQEPPPAFPPPPIDPSGDVPDPSPMDDVSAPSPLTGAFSPPASGVDPLPSDPGPMPELVLSSDDRDVDARTEAILGRAEFREFADHRGEGLRDLFERLFEWLFRPRDDLPALNAPNLGGLALPGAWFFVSAGAVLLLVVLAYLWLTRRKEREETRKIEDAAKVGGDPRDRPPAAFLDDAARFADEGDLREALRALYLATLVALDRRRLIAFDPHLTNWQYLRHMPRGEARDAFAQFTRLFDYKWYGLEPTTRHDYERCRTLASEIVGEPRAEAAT